MTPSDDSDASDDDDDDYDDGDDSDDNNDDGDDSDDTQKLACFRVIANERVDIGQLVQDHRKLRDLAF
jgi:hypothetical protein